MKPEPLNFPIPYGIIIRKDSLEKKNLSREQILSTLETEALYDETEKLISIGPVFGPEASEELSKRLENMGLSFFIDYFYLENDLPEWLNCQVYFRPSNSASNQTPL